MKGMIAEKVGAGIVLLSSVLLAQSPSPIGQDSVWELVSKFGLPTALTIALMLGWYKRDQRQQERHEQTQDFVQNKLVALVEDSSVSKREVASALNKFADAVNKCGGPAKPA